MNPAFFYQPPTEKPMWPEGAFGDLVKASYPQSQQYMIQDVTPTMISEVNAMDTGFAEPSAPPGTPILPISGSIRMENKLDGSRIIELPILDTSTFIPTTMASKDYVTLRGIHVVVHSCYGPNMEKTFNLEGFKASRSPFQTDASAYPLNWKVNTPNADLSYDPDATTDDYSVPLTIRARQSLSDWYDGSKQGIIDQSDVNMIDTFRSRCFTLDIDPSYIKTDQDEPYIVDPNARDDRSTVSNLSQMTSRLSFEGMLQLLQQFGFQLGVDYNILAEITQSIRNTTPSFRQQCVYLKSESVIHDQTKMDILIRFNGFINAISFFMRNELPHLFDTWLTDFRFGGTGNINRLYRKHFFVEVIGFASQEDWIISNHDFTFESSRFDAFKSWLKRGPEHVISGFYALQQSNMSAFAQYDIRVANYANEIFERNLVFSEIQPISFYLPQDREMPETYLYEAEFIKLFANTLSTFPNDQYRDFKHNFETIAFKTLMPQCLWERAVLKSFHSTFHRDEFKFSSAEHIGSGGFGVVMGINWQSANRAENALVQRQHRREMFKHHQMILDAIFFQRTLFEAAGVYSAAGATFKASELRNPNFRSLHYIHFVAVLDGAATPITIDFSDYSKLSAKTFNEAWFLVNQSLHSDKNETNEEVLEELYLDLIRDVGPGVFKPLRSGQVIPKVISYSSDVQMNMVMKMAKTPQINIWQEEMVGEILGKRIVTPPIPPYHNIFGWNPERPIESRRPPTHFTKESNDTFVDVSFEESPRRLVILKSDDLREIYSFDMETLSLFPNNPETIASLQMTLPPLDNMNLVTAYGRCYDTNTLMTVIARKHRGSLHSLIADTVESYFNDPYGVALEALLNMKISRQVSYGDRPLSLFEYIRVLLDALRGIIYVNAVGMIHADVKTANMLVSADLRGFLADFGLCKPYGTGNGGAGTPSYLPPGFSQLYTFVPVDPWQDGYSFGKSLDIYSTLYKYSKNESETIYVNEAKARYVGCVFNKQMAEIMVNDSGEPIIRSNLTRFASGEFEKIPISQCIITQDTANAIITDLQSVSVFLTSTTTATLVMDDVTRVKNKVLTIDQIGPYILPADPELRINNMSLLRLAESILITLLKAIVADVKSNWPADLIVDDSNYGM